MQSEYMALCSACLQSLWLITIFRAIGYDILDPMVLLEDNQSCIEYSKNKILKLSIIWCENKSSKGILLWQKFQLRRMSLTFLLSLSMVIYSGNI